jgi:hypothetical protein
VPDRIGVEAVGRLEDSWTRCRNTSIDEDLAIAAGQDRNVTAGALEDADAAAQLMNLNERFGRLVTDEINNAAGFRVDL